MKRATLSFALAVLLASSAAAATGLIEATAADDIPVTVIRLSDRVALFRTTAGSQPTIIIGIQSAEGIVVVDTERSPSFTAAIREAIEAEMSGDIVYLINTHGHGDHVAGNQVFADATILAHENAAAEMQEVGQSVQVWSQRLQPAVAAWRTQYESLDEGSEEAGALAERITYHEQWLAGLGSDFELTLPDRTFGDRLTLDLGDLSLELIWFGSAHTEGDILIYCPQEVLLLVGDLFYSEGFPYVDSERIPYLGRWHATLDELMHRQEGVERVVTGHEEVLPLSHLDAIVDFIAEQQALFAGRESALFAFRDLHEAEGVEVALLRLKEMHAQPERFYVLHPELDSYAYRLMLAEDLDDALAIFMGLAELFPASDVAFDSLGEVYVRLGKTEAAIAAFERCLEFNPDNRNAAERLEVLKGDAGHSVGVLPQASDPQSQDPQTQAPLTVWYLGHCGFAVKVGERLLVFDYLSDRGTPSSGPLAGGLADGVIEPVDLEGLDVYVFVSHAHGDHYDPVILGWEDPVERITYFFGWDAGDNPEHHYFVEPRSTAAVDGMEIYTIYSHHDTVPEVAYLVHVNGRWIYHNGDYLQDYLADFQYLQTLTDHLDLAFTAGTHDERWQYTHQAQYLLEHFEPGILFAMHRGGAEEEAADLPQVMAERGYSSRILVPLRRGDRWVIER